MLLAPCIVGALLGLPTGAQPLALEVVCGLDRCPTADDLQRRLRGVLGYDPVQPGAPRRVQVHFAAAGEGVATELRLREGAEAAGARRFETAVADWDAVASATVMNLALIVDPGRIDLLVPPPAEPAPSEPGPAPSEPEPAPSEPEPQPSEPEPAPSEPEPQPSEPEPAEPEPVEPAPDPAEAPPAGPLGVDVILGGGASVGATPGVTGQMLLGGRVRRGALGGELGLRYSFATAEAFAGGDVFADLLAADLAGCLHLGPDARYTGCLTFLAGAQGVGAMDLPASRTVNLTALAVGARARVEWPVPSLPALRIGLGVDLRAPLWRTRLRVDGRLVWESAPLVLDGLLTTAWAF